MIVVRRQQNWGKWSQVFVMRTASHYNNKDTDALAFDCKIRKLLCVQNGQMNIGFHSILQKWSSGFISFEIRRPFLNK